MDNQLKPCPFCGSEAQMTTGFGAFGGRVQIDCTNCRNATWWWEEAVAVRSWNTRAALPSDADGAPTTTPVAWMIDWPDEPELGHYFGEEPNPSGRSVPLYAAPVAPAAVAPTYAQINEVWKRANGTYLDRNEFGAMVVDFARMLLAAPTPTVAADAAAPSHIDEALKQSRADRWTVFQNGVIVDGIGAQPDERAAKYLCTPKAGGEGYVIDRAPDSFELRDCEIIELHADEKSAFALVWNAIKAANRGGDIDVCSLIAASHIESVFGTRAAAPQAALSDEEIFVLADDFKSTEMACGVPVEYFDSVGFARAILGLPPAEHPSSMIVKHSARAVAPQAALTDEQIKQVWKRANGTHPDNGQFGCMVVDFARALLATAPSERMSDADRMHALCVEIDRNRRGVHYDGMPIWQAMCDALGDDCDSTAFRAAIDAARKAEIERSGQGGEA